MLLEWGSLGLTITNDFCKSSFCTRVSKRAGGPWSGQMCTSVVTVTAPFSSSSLEGMAGHRHLDTRMRAHSLPPTRHGGLAGSQPAAGGELRNDHPMHVAITVCMRLYLCLWWHFCVSLFYTLFIEDCIPLFCPSLCILDMSFFSGWRHIE